MFRAVSVRAAFAQGAPAHFGFGTPVTPQELAGIFRSRRMAADCRRAAATPRPARKIYAESCGACHGDKLQGNPAKGIGGDRLIGGRDTLATKAPIKTIESYGRIPRQCSTM